MSNIAQLSTSHQEDIASAVAPTVTSVPTPLTAWFAAVISIDMRPMITLKWRALVTVLRLMPLRIRPMAPVSAFPATKIAAVASLQPPVLIALTQSVMLAIPQLLALLGTPRSLNVSQTVLKAHILTSQLASVKTALPTVLCAPLQCCVPHA